MVVLNVVSCCSCPFVVYLGVLASESWREAWWPSPFTGQRQGWKPPRGPSGSALLLCSGSALLGDLLGVSRSRERDLSVLLIYPRIFLHVFIAYRLLEGGHFCVIVFCYMFMCVLVVLVNLSILAKWLAMERPLWWHLHEVRRLSPQSPGGRAFLFVFFFCLVCLYCYVFPHPPLWPYTIYIPYAYGTI